MSYDVVIAGGGPAGLSAALMLGRGRKRVLLCDAGPPRNAAAEQIHNFVTRDGTPPAEFRRVAREQLAPYRTVEVRDARIESIDGTRGAFDVQLAAGAVQARRVLLAVGMVDLPPELPGYRELWGTSIFQCPYCHAWEVSDKAFGYLAPSAQWLEWSILLRGWTRDIVVFTDARFEVPAEVRARLESAGVRIDERRIRRLVPRGNHLAAVEFDDGAHLARDVLFARPSQRQTDFVARLGLDLDEQGFVKINEQMQTSRSGIFAAGDLATFMQGAVMAAAAGTRAAGALNHELTVELALAGALP